MACMNNEHLFFSNSWRRKLSEIHYQSIVHHPMALYHKKDGNNLVSYIQWVRVEENFSLYFMSKIWSRLDNAAVNLQHRHQARWL